MAVIVGEGVQKALKSPLSFAPLDRAIDCLKLAQMGHQESRRTWNDFAQESPGTARVVAAAVAKDNAEIAAATKRADKMLARGESIVTKGYSPPVKPKKPKKAAKKAARRAETGFLTKAAQRQAVRAMTVADLSSPDPHQRLVAMDILMRGLV